MELPRFDEPAHGAVSPDGGSPGQAPQIRPPVEQKPWYYSPAAMVFTFLFATPVWSILVLTSQWQSKAVKVIAGLVGVGYLYLCVSLVVGLGGAAVGGPATIEFGSHLVKSGNDITVANKTSKFSHSISSYARWAWVAHLNRPAGTTLIRLTMSQYDAAGGEKVIDETVVSLADPNYTIIYGEGSPWLTNILTGGTFTLRVMSGNQVLASGRFSVVSQ